MLKRTNEFKFERVIDASNIISDLSPLSPLDAFADTPIQVSALNAEVPAVAGLSIDVTDVASPPTSWSDVKDAPLAIAAGNAVEGGGMFQHPGVSTDMVLTLARMSQAAYDTPNDVAQLESLKQEGWRFLTTGSINWTTGQAIWNGIYYTKNIGVLNLPQAAAIVAVRGDELVLSFRGTDQKPEDFFSYSGIASANGDYITQGYSDLFEGLAEYLQTKGRNITKAYVTGHSLGGAAANQLRQQSATLVGGLFNTAKFVTFATPTVATKTDVLNIGFANDFVFGLTSGDLATKLAAAKAATTNLFSSHDPHSRVGYVDMVRTVTRLSEYYQLLNRRSSVLVGTAGQKDVGAVGFFISNLDGGEVNYTFAHPTTFGQRIEGSLGNDVIVGSDFGDEITSQTGNDQIEGFGGSDIINAGLGDDLVYTLADLDEIDGGFGIDTIDIRSRTESRTYRFEASETRLRVNDSVFLSAILKNIEVFMGGDVGDTFSMETAGSTFGQIRLVGRGGSDAYRFGSNLSITSIIDDEGLIDTISIAGARFSGEAQERAAGSNVYTLLGRDVRKVSNTSLAIRIGDQSVIVESWSQGDYGITLRPFGAPPPPPPPTGSPGVPGNTLNPGFGRTTAGFDQAGQRMGDPLVFDLDGDGLELTDATAQPVLFDIDGDGILERTGWVSSDDGFLVRDENGNGRIDNVWEMFGDPTQLGFDELKALNTATDQMGFDTNQIDRNDSAWGELRIWRDLNQNGSTDAGELASLEEIGIFSISLAARRVNRVDNGNLIFEEADFTKGAGGRFATVAEVFFGFQETVGPESIGPNASAAPGTFALPESRGYGNLWSWSRKAAVDADFRTALTALSSLQLSQLGQADGLAEKLLYAWADAENINPAARGTFFDARKLAVLEAAIGRGFVDATGLLNPDSRTAPFLKAAWDSFLTMVSDRALMQLAIRSVFGTTSYDFTNDEVAFTASYATIEGRLLALNETDRAAALAQVETIIEANESRLGLAPGETAIRFGRLNATLQSDAQLFANALRTFSGVARTDISYPSFNGWVQVQDISLPTGDRVAVGTAQGDRVFAMGTGRLLFSGGAGNDALWHRASNSLILLGEGNDIYSPMSPTVADQVEAVRVYGGAGNDGVTLWGSVASQIYGGDGNDTLTFYGAGTPVGTVQSNNAISERNTAYGGIGNDTISLSGFRNLGFGEGGDDRIEVGSWGISDSFFLRADGGDGADTIIGMTGGSSRGANQATVFAGAGNDTLIGLFLHSTLELGSGNDIADISLNDSTSSLTGSFLQGGDGDDSITINQTGRGFFGEIFARTRIDSGVGNDLVTILGDSGGFNRTPIIVESSLGADKLVLRGRAVLRVAITANDLETIEFETRAGNTDSSGYGLILDLQAFSQYRSLSDLSIQKGADIWTILLPNAQRIELKRTGIADFKDIIGIFADGIATGTPEPDRWVGTYGKETYSAGSGDDYANGDEGDDVLNGEAGFDLLYGEWGNDTLNGGDGNDTLDGGLGLDVLNGGNGADRLIAGVGDILDGGTGMDTASLDFRQASGPLFLDLSAIWTGGVGRFGNSQAMAGRLSNVEKFEIQASALSDFVDFGLGAIDTQFLVMGAGNDTVKGGNGADQLLGGAGADFIEGNGGNDQLGETRGLFGVFDFGEELGDDTLLGGDGNDSLGGGAGNDVLRGDSGADELNGGLGIDTLDGGTGFDFATYANATSGLTLFMGGGTFNTGEAKGDVHTSIEGLIGSAFDDIIGGLADNNELRGLNGNDFIYGRAGVDTLLGGDGNDVLDGGLDGDVLRGEAGIDVAYYRDATATVTASLLSGGTGGEATGDTYFDIENIWGSRFGDVLTGDNNGGQVYGFEGNDTLSGLGGDDFFYGGEGFDTLTGGTGVDNFFFLSWNDHFNQYGTLEPYEGGDTFTDFASGTDRIILSRYWFGFGNIGGPAAALTETHANFVTNGAAATSRPTLIWNQTNRTLSFDADGNGATQAVLLGTFQQGVTLTLGDIWTA